MALDMKQTMRDILTEEYGLSGAEPTDGGSDEKTFDLFAIARRAHNDSAEALQTDEVDDFFEVTKKPDNSCRDIVLWWMTVGSTRFPTLRLLARDTIMIMGTSMPSKSAFSDSGHVVTAIRA